MTEILRLNTYDGIVNDNERTTKMNELMNE